MISRRAQRLPWIALAIFIALGAPAEARKAKMPPPPPPWRCMNLGNALEAPHEGDWGYVIQRGDLLTLRKAGFGVVRIPAAFATHAEAAPPYLIDPAFLARVDQVIDWALAEQLTVIVDLHGYSAYNADPAGQSDRLVAIWAQLAAHFRDRPPSVILELLNEPTVAPDRLAADMARVIAAIRDADPERRLIWGATDKNSRAALLATVPPKGSHLIATFHYYDPFSFTHAGTSPRGSAANAPSSHGSDLPGWGSDAELRILRHDFDQVRAWADRFGATVFLGEFGVSAAQPLDARTRYLAAVRQQAERHGFAWCNWATYARFDAWTPDRQFIPEILDALIPR